MKIHTCVVLGGCVASSFTSAQEPCTSMPEGKIIEKGCVYTEITPAAGPRVLDGCNAFFTGEYLCWVAREDNLSYAATGYSLSDSPLAQGSVSNLRFLYETGFRVGWGVDFSHDSWDMDYQYTWFQSGKNRGHIAQSNGVTPLFPLVTSAEEMYTSARAFWRLHFQVVDGELGRNFFVSKYLSLRPFLGLKATWQKQKYETAYATDALSSYQSDARVAFWGVGIRPGLDMTWHLSDTWSLLGKIAGSGVWGQFITDRNDFSVDGLPVVNSKNHFDSVVPVLEAMIGIRKEAWFLHDRLHVEVQAGWEEQIWWDQNRFDGLSAQSRGGNLTLEGLTARLRVDF